MSILVMTDVWAHSKSKGSALLLLLAIADHAHDDRSGAYPAIETLARKVRMSARNVQMLIRQLEARGELSVELNAGPHRANLYTVQSFQGEIQSSEGVKQPSPKSSSEENHHTTTITSGSDLLSLFSAEELAKFQARVPHADLEWEADKCVVWWADEGKVMQRPRAALMNWISKLGGNGHGPPVNGKDPFGVGGEYEGMQRARLVKRR